MTYTYGGFAAKLFPKPDEEQLQTLPAVTLTQRDIYQWTHQDIDQNKKIAASHKKIKEGIQFTGRFGSVSALNCISLKEPVIFASMGTFGWQNEIFPIDTQQYPVLEITYRVPDDLIQPRITWFYEGGQVEEVLPVTRKWETVALLMVWKGFPEKIENVVVRMYSSVCATRTLEIASVRFRALSEEEALAIKDAEKYPCGREYDFPDSAAEPFMPIAVQMNAGTARRLAEMLGLSLAEYWNLAFEDIVLHHHNSVVLEECFSLNLEEIREFLSCAEHFSLRVILSITTLDCDGDDLSEITIERIRTLGDSKVILGWYIVPDPSDSNLERLARIRWKIAEAAPLHQVSIRLHSAFSLARVGRCFSSYTIPFRRNHIPWSLGNEIRIHHPLTDGIPLWVESTTSLNGMNVPKWSTCPEMRLQMGMAFARGVQGWITDRYHNDPLWTGGTHQRSLTGSFLTFSDLWSELGSGAEMYNAIAPLLLDMTPVPLRRVPFISKCEAAENAQTFEKLPPAQWYRLRGESFNVFMVISMDIRGVTSLEVQIPQRLLRRASIFNLTDFVYKREWKRMLLKQHVEMFPGYAYAILVGGGDICEKWRAEIAERLIEDDRRQLYIRRKLCEAHGVDLSEPDALVRQASLEGDLRKLQLMEQAHAMMIDLIYETPGLADARSAIIRAMAIACACDGVLCRMVTQGRPAMAQEWGMKVISLAREFTHLRLELRAGKGKDILPHCEHLVQRASELLEKLHEMSKPVSSMV